MSDYVGPLEPVLPGQEKMAALKAKLAGGPASLDAATLQSLGLVGAQAAATTYEEHLVATYERAQTTYYFCGPAAIQDMSDYSWNKGATGVKYSQQYISDKWTHTGIDGTGITAELTGANGVLVGSPKSGWPYYLRRPTDGADWSNKLWTDLVLAMPQIMNVSPWWKSSSGAWFHLASWANHQSTGGHWIVGNGSQGLWDGTSGPNVRYDDGSGNYNGSTGTFWDNQYTMWQLIYHRNNAVIW